MLMAQDPRGSITGQLSDASGAVMPGVSVRFKHRDTNIVTTATTNQAGLYDAPYLPIGEYEITIEAPGFKTWTRPGVQVRIGDRVRIDAVMEVGSAAESVQVTAESPVLEAATGTIGQVMTGRQFSDLPMRSGNVAWLYSMAPGVVLSTLPYDGPWNIQQASEVAVGGSRRSGGGVDFNVDGVSNNSYQGQTAFVPPPDMVQEVRIDTSSYDAAIGYSTGGSINVSLKSGTNQLHGSVAASVASGPMMTRNFFTNRFIFDPNTGPITDDKIKANTPQGRWLRYSTAVGGPVFLPKLFDGRNRTFWMFGFQAHERRRATSTINTVPTAEQKEGNFSALLALGPQYQIYDPMTTRPSGASRFQRDPFPGNIIPANRISSAARNILKYFPEPNTQGTAEGLNNYARTRQDRQDLYQPVVRVDHNFSEKHRMFFRYAQSNFTGTFDRLIEGSDARGRLRKRPYRGIALDSTSLLSPTVMLNVRYGFTWFREWESFANIGQDLTEFGFPQSLISQLNPNGISFPQINISGPAFLQLGNNGGFQRTNYSHTLLGVVNMTRGAHSIKAGFDGRLLLENNTTYGNVSPQMNFAETFTRGPLDNSPIAPFGQGIASFLLGIPTGGGIDLNDSRAERSPFYSFFVQDDWRVRSNLTLNLGLRWEIERPIVERFDRTTLDFDFGVVNPIQEQARAQYSRSPIPEIAPASFQTLGGLTFAGRNGLPRGVRPTDWKAVMPRLGFAWQAHRRVVVRGGYGIFFGLLGAQFDDVSQPGFNQRTNVVSSVDNGQTYIASISNPFPGGLEPAPGASGGLTTFLGRAPGFFAQDGRRPYTQRWSYSIQVEPLPRSVFEVGYIGSRGTRLRVSTPLNAIPRQYQSTSPDRDQAMIDFLSARVANPFIGIPGFAGTAFFNGVNTTRAQLLRPYPHFGELSADLPAGSSWYHAMTARFERRFQAGLQFQANYTWSKTMEAVSYLNDTDPAPEHVIADIDRPHRFTFSGIYELPFGRKKKWLSGAHPILNGIVGGWQVQAIHQRQSGPGLAFGNVITHGTFDQLAVPDQNIDRWFNTDIFDRRANAQLENNIRTLSTRTGAVRAGGINVWDLSAHKNFVVRERLTVQLRGEAEGATNTPNFAPPNLNPTSSLFGRVNNTQTGQEERRIFVGLKLIF
jgi:hypothetical protein